ncbi:MAG: hypothetical protein ACI4XF_00145 [Oscillospiraceae bacterium]
MAMFDFMKKKKDEPEITQPAPSAPVKKPAVVNSDDFFADLDRKAKTRPAKKIEADVAVPEVTGLREKPLEAAPDALSGISTDAVDTSGLVEDNPYIDKNAVYGDLAEIDISAIDTSGLRDEQ